MALDVEVQEHSLFFDFLANLVQAKHYYDPDQEQLNPKYMKKAARLEAKRTMKEQYTKNKKAKLNPDTAATTLSVQQRAADEQQEDAPAQAGLLRFCSSAKQLSREELREKLRQKVEALRSQRSQDKEQPDTGVDANKAAQEAKEWRQKQLAKKQQKPAGEQQQQQKPQQHKGAAQQQPKQQQQPQQKQRKQQQQEGGLSFGNLIINPDSRSWEHKKKATKEELLKQVEAKKLQQAEVAQTAEGKAQVKQEAWAAALHRAKGEKVLDDPKLLRRSLKKESKKREKSAKTWQERNHHQKEQRDKKQQRRTDNLTTRSQGKIQKKKERREKKLLGAGFEGRKEGFIGGKGAGK